MEQLNFQNKSKAELAIEFIQKHEPKDSLYMLCYSGGKDSVVLEHLTRMANVKYAVFYSLMPDPPELIKFIKSRNFKINILKPEFNYWQGIIKKFPPHRKAAWCCSHIKEKPSAKIPIIHRLLGIRAEESYKRADLGMINQITKKRINYHPIFHWSDWEVWAYINENKLETCSLYDERFSRIGCIVCPKRSYNNLMICKERWPQYFKLFEKTVGKWWDSKGFHRQRIRGYCYFYEEFLDNWYRGR